MDKPVYYDERRPASRGKWVVIERSGCIVEHIGYATEEEAREAARGSA
jgi:hypothetical protein